MLIKRKGTKKIMAQEEEDHLTKRKEDKKEMLTIEEEEVKVELSHIGRKCL